MKELTRRRFVVKALDPRNVGWWLLAIASLGGAALMVKALASAVGTFPDALATALVLSVPITIGWWWLLRMPQLWARVSGSGAVAAMAWGGFAATGIYALPANGALITMLGQYVSTDFAQDWAAAIAAPLTEETGKALAVAAVLLASRERLRTPMDGALIAGFSAVGFTVVEDLLYALNIAWLNLGEAPVIATGAIYLVRAVIFGLVAHVVFSALVGAGIGWIATGKAAGAGWGRLPVGIGLMLSGAGLHGLWNSPLLLDWWQRAAYVVAVPFLMWLLLTRMRRAELAWFMRTLSAPGVLGQVDQSWLGLVKRSWWARRRYRKDVERSWGWRAVQSQRQAEALLSDLADAAFMRDDAAAAELRAELERRAAVSLGQ